MSVEKENKGIEVIKLTKIATIVMTCVSAVAVIFGYYICKYIWQTNIVSWGFRPIENEAIAFPLLIGIYYVGLIFAFIILFNVIKLLDNMKVNKVFIKENTKLMKNMSASCIAIFAVSVAGMIVWPSLLFIGVVGLFMGLIVQCVRVVMDKAIDMRDELDYTV